MVKRSEDYGEKTGMFGKIGGGDDWHYTIGSEWLLNGLYYVALLGMQQVVQK